MLFSTIINMPSINITDKLWLVLLFTALRIYGGARGLTDFWLHNIKHYKILLFAGDTLCNF